MLITQRDEKIRGLEVSIEDSKKQIENERAWYINALSVKDNLMEQREVFLLLLQVVKSQFFMFQEGCQISYL